MPLCYYAFHDMPSASFTPSDILLSDIDTPLSIRCHYFRHAADTSLMMPLMALIDAIFADYCRHCHFFFFFFFRHCHTPLRRFHSFSPFHYFASPFSFFSDIADIFSDISLLFSLMLDFARPTALMLPMLMLLILL